MMMGEDDDDVVCVFFPDCLLFPSLLIAAGECVLCVALLSSCPMCADSNSVPVHMVGGSWGSVGKPRGAHKNRHRHRPQAQAHKIHRHTVMTHLGEVPIYLGIGGGSSQTQTDGLAGQARS